MQDQSLKDLENAFKDTNYLKFVMAGDYRLVQHIKIKYMYQNHEPFTKY